MKQFECYICRNVKSGKKFKTKDGKTICAQCALSAVSGTNKTIIVWMHTAEEYIQMIYKNQNKTFDLNTAKGMYDYAVKQGSAIQTTEKWGIKHFSEIRSSLLKDEIVEFPFVCLDTLESNLATACAITNKRIIFARKKLMSSITDAIYLDKINDVSMNVGQIFAVIKITLNNRCVNIKLSKVHAETVYRLINDKVSKLKGSNSNNVILKDDDKKSNITNRFDEIREFKKLFDDGIISEEEFNKKKKEILKL